LGAPPDRYQPLCIGGARHSFLTFRPFKIKSAYH
jgi:hypothetical protein